MLVSKPLLETVGKDILAAVSVKHCFVTDTKAAYFENRRSTTMMEFISQILTKPDINP